MDDDTDSNISIDDEVQQEREDFDFAAIMELEDEVTQDHPVLETDIIIARTAITKVCPFIL